VEVGLHYYKLLQTNSVSAGVLYARFNVFNNPSKFYIGFVDVQWPTEDDQDRLNQVGVMTECV